MNDICTTCGDFITRLRNAPSLHTHELIVSTFDTHKREAHHIGCSHDDTPSIYRRASAT